MVCGRLEEEKESDFNAEPRCHKEGVQSSGRGTISCFQAKVPKASVDRRSDLNGGLGRW